MCITNTEDDIVSAYPLIATANACGYSIADGWLVVIDELACEEIWDAHDDGRRTQDLIEDMERWERTGYREGHVLAFVLDVDTVSIGGHDWTEDAAERALAQHDLADSLPHHLAAAAYIFGLTDGGDPDEILSGLRAGYEPSRREYGVPMGDGACWGV